MNRSVADRGSRAMIGLRICAFSSDFKVTEIYNQMAYDTLVKSHPRLMTGEENESGHFRGIRLTSRCGPLRGCTVVFFYYDT